MTARWSGTFAELETALVAQVRRLKEPDPFAPLTVVTGSSLVANHLARILARSLGAYVNVRLTSIHDLARQLAAEALARQGWRAAPALARERLVVRLLRMRSPDGYFAPVASMPGLPAALARSLNDLREACLRPEQVAELAGQGNMAAKMAAVAAIYAEYVRALQEARLADDAELYARAVARQAVDPWPAAEPLFLYGLYDLAEMQRRLLVSLRERIAHSFEPALPNASDTLASILGGSARPCAQAVPGLQRRAEPSSLERVVTTVNADPSLVTSSVAGDDVPPVAGPQTGGGERPPNDGSLALVSVADEAAQRSAVAREIMARVSSGVALHALGVVVVGERQRAAVAATLEAAGIRVALQRRGTNVRAKGLRALLDCLLPANGEALQRTAVLELAASTGVSAAAAQAVEVARWDRLSRRARVVAGASQWAERLAAEQRRLAWQRGRLSVEGTPADLAENEREQEALRSLITFVERLHDFRKRFPASGSWSAFVAALLDVAGDLADGESSDENGDLDTDQALQAVRALAALDAVEDRVVRGEFAAVARRALDAVIERCGVVGQDGVAILSPHEVRGLAFDTLIICDLAEGGYPGRVPSDPILLDDERERLSAGGDVYLETARKRESQAGSLLALALQAARQRAVLIYPRLEASTGKPRLPSRLLLAVASACTGSPVSFAALDQAGALGGLVQRLPTTAVPPLASGGDEGRGFSAGPPATAGVALEAAVDEREFDLIALLAFGGGRRDEATRAYVERLVGASRAARLRAAREAPHLAYLTAHDGRVAPARAAAATEAVFAGPLSPSALQTYLTCPFAFLARYVLGFALIEEPADSGEIEPADYGELAHAILRDVYRLVAEQPAMTAAEAAVALDEVAERACRRAEADGVTGYPLSWSVKRRQLVRDLKESLARDPCWQDELRPALLEWRFGDSEEVTPQLAVGGRNVRFAGRVDRIDRSADGTCVRLIDYKTGKGDTERDQLRKHINVQLPVYRLAAGLLQPPPQSIACEFRLVSRKGRFASLPMTGDETAVTADLTRVMQVVTEALSAGLFPRWRTEERRCSLCDLRDGCDAAQWSFLVKQDGDAALAKLRRLKEGSDVSDE